MIILGLNAYHGDSAACLIVDGQLVAAAEEERFRRIKHWAGLPTKAIDYCLSEARLNLSEVEHIAINRKPGINNWRRFGFVVTQWPSPKLMLQKIKNIRSAISARETLEQTYKMELKAQIHHVEHHLAHLASAFLVSDFREAACISVDGFGDFASTAFGFGSGEKLTISKRIYFPHSLGIFYSALTQYLGFPHYGDEYKVMGLAPYGEPNMIEPLREVVRIQTDGTFRLNLDYFRHHSDNVSYTWKDCTPSVGLLYKSTLLDLLGPARAPNEPLEQKHKDLARSIQVTYEKAFFALLHALHKMHPSNNLALAGGCAMNSVANGKVYRRTPFTQMYLPAAAGDAGGAIGAAAVVLAELGEEGIQTTTVMRRASEVRSGSASVSEVREAVPEPTSEAEEEWAPAVVSGGEAVHQTSEAEENAEKLKAETLKERESDGGTRAVVSGAVDQASVATATSSVGEEGGGQKSEVGAIAGRAEAKRRLDLNRAGARQKEEGEEANAERPIQKSEESAILIPKSEIAPPELPAPTSNLPASLFLAGPEEEEAPVPIPSVPLRPLNSAYLGPESTQQEIHALLDWKKQEIGFAGCVTTFVSSEEALTTRTAQAIADGKVVGWFQGRMEWGPRALGNRSILADPRRADMKDILNAKIKRRESFRPFAPSILREAVTDWFEQDDDVPFMMEVFQIRAQKRSFIPAVTHVDGSGRLQTVHKETNPRYYRLIEKFRDLTGIPMVLNTSFNENEPVVCYPEEALDCFLRTKMDLLVLGNFCIERKA